MRCSHKREGSRQWRVSTEALTAGTAPAASLPRHSACCCASLLSDVPSTGQPRHCVWSTGGRQAEEGAQETKIRQCAVSPAVQARCSGSEGAGSSAGEGTCATLPPAAGRGVLLPGVALQLQTCAAALLQMRPGESIVRASERERTGHSHIALFSTHVRSFSNLWCRHCMLGCCTGGTRSERVGRRRGALSLPPTKG